MGFDARVCRGGAAGDFCFDFGVFDLPPIVQNNGAVEHEHGSQRHDELASEASFSASCKHPETGKGNGSACRPFSSLLLETFQQVGKCLKNSPSLHSMRLGVAWV